MMPDFSLLAGPTSPQQPDQKQTITDALADPANQAMVIDHAFAPSVLLEVAKGNLGNHVQALGYKEFYVRFMAANGKPKDPLEEMLLTQLMWCHHRIGSLHAEAANVKSPQHITALNTAVAKLMAEHRRHSMALREYRAPQVPQQLTVVQQQNVAAGNQQVALIDGNSGSEIPEEKPYDTELGSNRKVLAHGKPNGGFANTFPTPDRRETEPCQAQGTHASRPAATTRDSQEESTVDTLNRPKEPPGKGPQRRKRQGATN